LLFFEKSITMKNTTCLLLCFFIVSIGFAQNVGINTTTPHAPLQFSNDIVSRKIVLFEGVDNDHQFYGLGVNGGIFRYQVSTSGDSHVFYAGLTSSTSAELMRIQGDGKVGIGTTTPAKLLDVAGDALINGLTVGTGSPSGILNTALGFAALVGNTGSKNTGVGNQVLFQNTGTKNTALGNVALRTNKSGSDNTAAGDGALTGNQFGSGNTALGSAALGPTNGSNNTAVGYNSLIKNITGTSNTGVGALVNVSTDNLVNATAIGANAYVSASNSLVLGSIDGVNGATSNVNVGIGTTSPHGSLHFGNTISNRKIVLFEGTDNDNQFYGFGINAGALRYQILSGGDSHVFYAGATAITSTELMRIQGDGNVGIGTNAPTAKLSVNGTANNTTGAWGVFSDERIKTVTNEFTDGLNVIEQINPVVFTYNADAPFANNKQQVGVVAQELEKIAPYMVSAQAFAQYKDLREVSNQAYTFLLINAVKEQQAQIEAMKKEMEAMKQELKGKK
jgi:hypothetical protein